MKNIKIIPETVFKKLLLFIIFLLCINVVGNISKFYFDADFVWIPLFDFDVERNVPTLYSSFALLVSSILLSIIAMVHNRFDKSYIGWVGLAIIFMFLSVDEIASIHEKLTNVTRATLDTSTSGLLRNAWIIPYGIALVLFCLSYLRFLLKLPKKVMRLFILSGVVFVSGAIGFESIGGLFINSSRLAYSFILTTEEFFEMLGVVIFIYSLLKYIVIEFGHLSFSIQKEEKDKKSNSVDIEDQ